jgi:hypothetical protein
VTSSLKSGVFALLAVSFQALPAASVADQTIPEQEYSAALCEAAIINGARRGGVPARILHAISLTETGRNQNGRLRPWPWAINREGKSHWFTNREDAIAFARQSIADGRRSFDVGCVQINYRWHGHAFPTLEDMFNPEWTATYAAQFLRTLYEERQSWSAAAGAYHSLSPDLAQNYRKRFDRLLAGLSPDDLSPDDINRFATETPPGDFSGNAGSPDRHRIPALSAMQRSQTEAPLREAHNGSVADHMFRPAAGILLNHGTPILRQSQPLLTAPPGKMY